jgi:hypothetical protein
MPQQSSEAKLLGSVWCSHGISCWRRNVSCRCVASTAHLVIVLLFPLILALVHRKLVFWLEGPPGHINRAENVRAKTSAHTHASGRPGVTNRNACNGDWTRHTFIPFRLDYGSPLVAPRTMGSNGKATASGAINMRGLRGQLPGVSEGQSSPTDTSTISFSWGYQVRFRLQGRVAGPSNIRGPAHNFEELTRWNAANSLPSHVSLDPWPCSWPRL